MNIPKFSGRLIIAFLFILSVSNLYAFYPAGHLVFLEKTLELAGPGRIADAIRHYPAIAAAGAIAPDAGYAESPVLRPDYSPWGDRFHYDRAGQFCSQLLSLAFESGDEKNIAFAAGWLSHVIGDMAIHGGFINIDPAAGVYLENPSGRKRHKELELNAEPFIWIVIGGNPESKWNEAKLFKPRSVLSENFCDKKDIPYELIDEVCNNIWKQSPGKALANWYGTMIFGVKSGIGYQYVKSEKAFDFLDDTQKSSIRDSMDKGSRDAAILIADADKMMFENFSDGWNLDAIDQKYDKRPIGTLVVNIKTADTFCAGTNAEVYFGIIAQTGIIKEWLIEKAQYNDLERGKSEYYYFFTSDMDLTPETISGFSLRMGDKRGIASAWNCNSITVYINGIPGEIEVDKTFDKNNLIWYSGM